MTTMHPAMLLAVLLTAIATTTPASAQERSSGVFISQIGDTNVAIVRQQPNGRTQVRQTGEGNRALVATDTAIRTRTTLAQTGAGNVADVRQTGEGTALLDLIQQGTGNRMIASQAGTGGINGALIVQTGQANSIALTQLGAANEARLIQTGEGNAMTAAQLGDRNSLYWVQQGNNLPDLQITQSGGASAAISQR